MDKEVFREMLLPEMKFLADMPTELYLNMDVVNAIRTISWPSPPQELLEKVTFSDRPLLIEQGNSIMIRVYAPLSEPERVVLWCHGGGFFSGNLETEHLNCLNIAAGCNALVISPDYRLAPEHPFPAGLEDCYSALLFAKKCADERGLASLTVGGTSSGATLAAGLTQLARDRGERVITKQVLLVPPVLIDADTPSMKDYEDIPGGWNAQNARLIWKYYLPEGPLPPNMYPAPGLAGDLSGLPPAYIMTAEVDPLRDEGIWYAQQLEKNGVEVRHVDQPGITHFFLAAAGSAFFRDFTQELISVINDK